ncbi:MAG: cytochrome b5 [Caproiciproducens sp.]|nr:cytochrome b5 [Caproiciproducens sp.]
MKRKLMIMMACVMTAALLAFAGCASAGNSASSAGSSASAAGGSVTQTSSGTSTVSSSQKVFTKDELKKYDGQNGNPAYVAVNGTVYDVTNVPQWNGGSHHGLTAGQDLTKEIANAPHGTSVLANLPVVGKLQ